MLTFQEWRASRNEDEVDTIGQAGWAGVGGALYGAGKTAQIPYKVAKSILKNRNEPALKGLWNVGKDTAKSIVDVPKAAWKGAKRGWKDVRSIIAPGEGD